MAVRYHVHTYVVPQRPATRVHLALAALHAFLGLSWQAASLARVLTSLTGQLVRLDPLAPGDEDALWAAVDHDEVWAWMPPGRLGRDGYADFIASQLKENSAGRAATWVARLAGTGEVVGTSSYLAIRPEHRGVEIGATMYSPAVWRTGVNREAKLLMLEHGFETLGLQRIEFKTDARNERSRTALLALPAQFEGIFRRHMDTAQGVRDSAYYSVTVDDWSRVRSKLEADLASRPGAA